jgi:hypothetical protein
VSVEQTYTLWLLPYFCLREEAYPVVEGLTKDKAIHIMERDKDRAPGVMFIEPDEVEEGKTDEKE